MSTGAIITLAVLAAYLLAYGMAVAITKGMGDKKEFFGIVAGLLLLALTLNYFNV